MVVKEKKKYNLRTHIRSALRKIWMYSPMRRDALNRTKVGRGKYRCPQCLRWFTNQQSLEVDHVVKVTPAGFDPETDPTQWGVVIKNMLYMDPVNGLVAMCKECHKKKTAEEKRETKRKVKKKSKTNTKRPSRNKRVRAD